MKFGSLCQDLLLYRCHTSPGTRNEGDEDILKYNFFYFHNQTEEHMETSHITFNMGQNTLYIDKTN